MRGRQKQEVEAFLRVQDFVTAHPLTAPATYGHAKTALDDAVAQAQVRSGEQLAGTRYMSAAVELALLRRALVEQHLLPIAVEPDVR